MSLHTLEKVSRMILDATSVVGWRTRLLVHPRFPLALSLLFSCVVCVCVSDVCVCHSRWGSEDSSQQSVYPSIMQVLGVELRSSG